MKRRDFNRKWYPVIKEVLEALDENGLLDISKEAVESVDGIIVSTSKSKNVVPDRIEKNLNLNLYTVNNEKIISTNRKFKQTIKDAVESILSETLIEREVIVPDVEYKVLVDLLVETVLVGMDDSIGPIFQVEVRNSYINVYPKYLVIATFTKNNGRRTVKSLNISELAKQLLGEFRRQVKLKDKWVPMSYELYKEYRYNGLIRTSDVENRLSLLTEKMRNFEPRFNKRTFKLIKMFTIFDDKDIANLTSSELASIVNNLIMLKDIFEDYRKDSIKFSNLETHIPGYFKVYVKFK